MDTSDERPDKNLETRITVINGNKDRSFPLTQVYITLIYDQQQDTVCLKSIAFKFNYSSAEHVSHNICSMPNGSYLLSDYARKSVVSLKTSSNNVRYIEVSGHPDCLCKISDNVAAVCVEQYTVSSKVFVFNINSMLWDRSFEITYRSTGMACIKETLFIGSSDRINVYTLQGKFIRHIFNQSRTPHSLLRMTKGPNHSLICVCRENRSTAWVCINIDIDGHLLRTVFQSSRHNLRPIDNYLLIAGKDGQVYLFERLRPFNCEVLRIEEKRAKTIRLSSPVKAVSFDEHLDMLVIFTDNHFYLRYSDSEIV